MSQTSTTIPKTQTAWRSVQRGTPEQSLVLQEDVPVISTLAPGEVLVNIKAAALNPVGYKLMSLLPNFLAKRPHTAEYDFAGVVVDQKDTSFKVGDEVYGLRPAGPLFPSQGQGALASYISIASQHIARKPASMKWTEAAGLSLVGQTATQALLGFGDIKPGHRVLINGGSTAVGMMAIQIAKCKECHVVVTTSAKNETLVKALGADEVVDYTKMPPEELYVQSPPSKPFDVIFDTVGNSPGLFLNSEPYLHPDGIYISVGGSMPSGGISSWVSMGISAVRTKLQPTWAGGLARRQVNFLTDPTAKWLPPFAKLVDEDKIQPVVDSVYAFKDVLKAYERIMTGHAAGKVVVEITPST